MRGGESRSIALHILNCSARWEMGCQRHALAALFQGKSPCTHHTRGWIGPTAGLDVCGQGENYFPPPELKA